MGKGVTVCLMRERKPETQHMGILSKAWSATILLSWLFSFPRGLESLGLFTAILAAPAAQRGPLSE
ncbi:hypothetical protein Poly51_42780 [Rubripirellula tenax]|uniref:Uncharacterized protein n=1 Tax=Rubripirellula tenax TaxID=2528015 RepID=A0A5C6EQR3_9BACT|nr:hypothetical protein Poly51_42780 [Rubripirellula tenax]